MAVSFQIVYSDRQSQVVAGQSIMTYAKAAVACGSMVLFFFCRLFFALQGEK
jgi:hypothetical protein